MNEIKIIYCRGGDKSAPIIAKASGMLYGVRYDATAYDKNIYMIDGGEHPKWTLFMRRIKKVKPTFALTPDYFKSDPIALSLRIMDMSSYVKHVGVCPKFVGAVAEIPNDCIICESIDSKYAGWHIPDNEVLADRDYHLLGGDPRLQKSEKQRIENLGGKVISIDGNKIGLKAAYGQIFCNGKWIKNKASNEENALISAHEIIKFLTT